DLAAQIAGVRRGLARVAMLVSAVVHRRVPVVPALVRRDVVADAEVEVALAVEDEAGAADVAGAITGRAVDRARAPVGAARDLGLVDAQDLALGAGHHARAVGVEREAADDVVAEVVPAARRLPLGVARRVVDVDVALVRVREIEAGLEAHAEHAVLGVRVVGAGRDRGDDRGVVRLALRVVHLDVALGVVVGPAALRTDLGPVDLAVLRDVDRDRVVRVRDEDLAGVVRPHGAAAVGLLALARGPADGPDEVLDDVVVAAVL